MQTHSYVSHDSHELKMILKMIFGMIILMTIMMIPVIIPMMINILCYYDTRTFPFLILISCIGHQRVKSEKQEFSLPEFPALRQNLTETFWIVGQNCLKTWRISNQIKKTKYILFTFQRVVCLPATKSGSKKWFQRELFGYQILVKWSLISILKQELSVN